MKDKHIFNGNIYVSMYACVIKLMYWYSSMHINELPNTLSIIHVWNALIKPSVDTIYLYEAGGKRVNLVQISFWVKRSWSLGRGWEWRGSVGTFSDLSLSQKLFGNFLEIFRNSGGCPGSSEWYCVAAKWQNKILIRPSPKWSCDHARFTCWIYMQMHT